LGSATIRKRAWRRGRDVPHPSRAVAKLVLKRSSENSRNKVSGSRPERPSQFGGTKEHMATKLFVGNLPHSVTDVSLGEFVTNAGFQIASAVVVRDKFSGTPRGFGFVELAGNEDIQRAIAGLNGQSLDGRPLTVNEARPQRTAFSRHGGGGGRRDNFRRRDY